MTTDYKRTLMLFAIFIAAFLFRVGILFHNESPPSSDIGFHSSIINLILDDGKLPLWNPYHMGGEPLATPPGYHLFASFIAFFTGMPLLVAQPLIAALFSSFAVFPMYLISKKIWRSNGAGFLAAFFVTVSSLSLEMLGWGGYPNVISLTLILIIFYLFLKDTDHSHNFNLFTAALLFGSLILTHLFSLFVLFPIIILYISLLLIGKTLKPAGTNSLNAIRFFFTSTALGTLFASPWLLRVSDFYLG
ncbi:MAG: dolichyl-diphosphooligosaccharide--protein glycosyltransferase subunit STT3, partial [Candidatus Bathyarchaeota archaeon]|nr:dolichyl-diphosphooligosaccharide--protein glycosyltransferase subunit STT3 [Candidatus Bathyarchaeota archaeon]